MCTLSLEDLCRDIDVAAAIDTYQGPVELALGAVNLAEVMKPTMDEHGAWTTAPATSIDGNDKRVIRASLRVAIAAGLNLDLNDHPEREEDQCT
jgi:hypothetical protein